MNRGLAIAGGCLMGATILIPLLVNLTNDDLDGFVFSLIFFFTLGPLLFITGLVLLIVGLASGRGGAQQQQQVVVHVSPGGAVGVSAPQVRCPKCKAVNPASSMFCSACGKGLGRPAGR